MGQSLAPSLPRRPTAYWHRIRKHRFGILGLALACGTLAGLVANTLPPRYRAEVTLLVNPSAEEARPDQSQADASRPLSLDSRTYVQTQIALLKSRALAEAVSERLKLWDDPELGPRTSAPRLAKIPADWASWVASWVAGPYPGAEPQAEARTVAIALMADRLRLETIPDSAVIRLSFTASNPALAARVANAYADAYLDAAITTRAQPATAPAVDLDSLREQLETSERKLRTYREAHGLADDGDSPDLTEKRLQALDDRLVEARAKRDDLQELHDQMPGATALSSAELTAHPILGRNITIQTLKAAELQADRSVAELAKRYGPLHPKMAAAQSELDALRATLDVELESGVAAIAQDLDNARSRVARLEVEHKALQEAVRDLRRQESELRSLERDLETNRRRYEMRRAGFRGAGQDVPPPGRVIDGALVPSSPSEPNIPALIAIAVLLGLAAGLVIVIWKEYRDQTLTSPKDIEACLPVPLLGTVPIVPGYRRKRKPLSRLLADEPKAQFSEAARTLRTGVLLSAPENSRQVVLVTSTVRGEGKTTIAVSLALALGQLGKVLLIDADLRGRPAADRLGLPAGTPGLSDLAAGTAEEAACIHRVDEMGIDILPAGPPPADPLELLSSRRFAQSLERLRERYDHIVIDSAAAQAVSDPLMLSRVCDAVVLVVRAGKAQLPEIQTTVRRLDRAGAPIIGAVLNACDDDRRRSY